MEPIKEADGSGQLDVNGHLSDAAYRLTARRDADQAFHVEISLTAPRDWLLKQGFESEAILVSETGQRIVVKTETGLDVTDSVAVVLTSKADVVRSQGDLETKYPELKPA